ncbi:MAG: hypothetical protein LBG77_09320, partial [Dysgonamonadaceae bacterium]|nr:hypothetical protein [Dysgonamonadaceae bacterium]
IIPRLCYTNDCGNGDKENILHQMFFAPLYARVGQLTKITDWGVHNFFDYINGIRNDLVFKIC